MQPVERSFTGDFEIISTPLNQIRSTRYPGFDSALTRIKQDGMRANPAPIVNEEADKSKTL
jgi:hypothetical protein